MHGQQNIMTQIKYNLM